MRTRIVGEKHEKTHLHLLNIGAREFALHGYAGVSMNSLASSAKLTKGALYDHFKSKDDIFVQSATHYIEAAQRRIAERAEISESAETALFQYLANLAEALADDEILRRLYIRLITEPHKQSKEVITATASNSPFSLTVKMLSAYRPKLNAEEYAFSILSIVLFSEDLKDIAGVLTPKLLQRNTTEAMLDHFRQILGSG